MLCKEKLRDRLSKGQTAKSITENDLFNDVAPDARSMIFNNNKTCLLINVNNTIFTCRDVTRHNQKRIKSKGTK